MQALGLGFGDLGRVGYVGRSLGMSVVRRAHFTG